MRTETAWVFRILYVQAIFTLLMLLVLGCGGNSAGVTSVRPLTVDEKLVFDFCTDFHGVTDIAEPVISTEIDKCKQSTWACYVHYGLIIIAPDVDEEVELFGRVHRETNSEVKGLILAHEITHYILDHLYGKENLDPLHKTPYFNENSCILLARDLII